MFKISLLKMSQQHVPRGGIFVVVFFKHYKMALWPISKTYEVNYAYLHTVEHEAHQAGMIYEYIT